MGWHAVKIDQSIKSITTHSVVANKVSLYSHGTKIQMFVERNVSGGFIVA